MGSILKRELREMARQWPTYWLRALAVAVGLGVFWWFSTTGSRIREPTGGMVFVGINKVLLALIWLVAPLLTADCLAREKREGTLGLLFLTPLMPWQVVVGKVFVHAMRGGILILAVLPVLMVPVLMGGVAWMDAVRMLLLQLAALALAMAAGVVASAWTVDWWRARLLALLLTLSASALFVGVYVAMRMGWVLQRTNEPLTVGKVVVIWATQLQVWLSRQLGWAPNAIWGWRRAGVGATTQDLWAAAGMLGICALLTVGAIGVATWILRRSWAAEIAGRPVPGWQRLLVKERFGVRRLQESRARMLQRNPMTWWFSRHWTVRVMSLAVAGLVVALISFTAPGAASLIQNYWIGRALSIGLALFAAAGLYRERNSGLMEILLVTPIQPTAILWGRALALVRQWGPAWIAFAGLAGYFDYQRYSHPGSYEGMFMVVKPVVFGQYLAFLWHGPTVIALGMYLSLRVKNFPVALLGTLLGTIGIRLVLSEWFQPAFWDYALAPSWPFSSPSRWTLPLLSLLAFDMLVQGTICVLAWVGAKRRLTVRSGRHPVALV
jgi:ABC-type transport system involved in multi-copper enzyme maturation permease subunit